MKRAYTVDRFFKEFKDFIQEFSIKEEEVRSEFERLDYSLNDFIWQLFNHTLTEISKLEIPLTSKYKHMKSVYGYMEGFLRKVEKKNSNHIHEQFLKYELLSSSDTSLQLEVCIIPDKRCSYSQTFNDRWFSYDECIDKLPIDLSKCELPLGCNCLTGCRGKRDSNNRLLNKMQ